MTTTPSKLGADMTDAEIMHVVRYSTAGSNAIAATEWCAFARAILARQPAAIGKEAVEQTVAGWKLAMRVLQSDLYSQLDDAERAECDALVRANPYIAAPLDTGESKPAPKVEQDERGAFKEFRAALCRFGDANTPMSIADRVMILSNATFLLDEYVRASSAVSAEPSVEQDDPTDYEALEREHFGDADKRTGIYAPKVEQDERGAFDLPPLPDPIRTFADHSCRAYSRQQMIDYARAASTSANVAQGAEAVALEACRAIVEWCDQNPPAGDALWCVQLARQAIASQTAQSGETTYSSTQATNCAKCGEHKHTPLRIDWMGGYVCLTCIDKELEALNPAAVLDDEPATCMCSGLGPCERPADVSCRIARAASPQPVAQGAEAATQIEQYVLSVLPSVYYMDPPDGGSVSVLEQLRRMADDAAKYRASTAQPALADDARAASQPDAPTPVADSGAIQAALDVLFKVRPKSTESDYVWIEIRKAQEGLRALAAAKPVSAAAAQGQTEDALTDAELKAIIRKVEDKLGIVWFVPDDSETFAWRHTNTNERDKFARAFAQAVKESK